MMIMTTTTTVMTMMMMTTVIIIEILVITMTYDVRMHVAVKSNLNHNQHKTLGEVLTFLTPKAVESPGAAKRPLVPMLGTSACEWTAMTTPLLSVIGR